MRGGFQQYLFQLFAIARGFFLAQQLQFELPRSDTLRNLNAAAAEFTQIARTSAVTLAGPRPLRIIERLVDPPVNPDQKRWSVASDVIKAGYLGFHFMLLLGKRVDLWSEFEAFPFDLLGKKEPGGDTGGAVIDEVDSLFVDGSARRWEEKRKRQNECEENSDP